MGPLCGLRLEQNASLILDNNNKTFFCDECKEKQTYLADIKNEKYTD